MVDGTQSQSAARSRAVEAAVRMVTSKAPRALYGGSRAVQVNPRFFAIDEPEEVPKRKTTSASAPPPPTRDHRMVREGGPHVGHLRGNALSQAPLDPLAARTLKVKDPVAYHVYCNQRPWVTQSSVIGEYNRTMKGVPRVPATAPVGANKREALRALRATSTRALGDNSKPGDMEAVSATRQGYVAAPPREPGDMDTSSKRNFVNPGTLPEPKTTKAPKPEDKAFFSKYPVDTSARDAVDSMRAPDGSLVAERPALVHPSVWRNVTMRDKAATMDDPHAHKRHGKGWMGTIGGLTV